MITQTKGIVFRLTPYSETSIIVTVFTKDFGLQSYIVNGVRSTLAKNKIALYQPLMMLDMIVYYKEHVTTISRIKEAFPSHAYTQLFVDMKKSSVALFLHEILNKTIKNQTHTSELYTFIRDSLIVLDELPQGVENFHLIFLIGLARMLGFGMHDVKEITTIARLTPEETQKMKNLLLSTYMTSVDLTHGQRKNILSSLLSFYAHHIGFTSPVRSVDVLHEMLH